MLHSCCTSERTAPFAPPCQIMHDGGELKGPYPVGRPAGMAGRHSLQAHLSASSTFHHA